MQAPSIHLRFSHRSHLCSTPFRHPYPLQIFDPLHVVTDALFLRTQAQIVLHVAYPHVYTELPHFRFVRLGLLILLPR
jgi:hypothetical protein